MNDKLREAALQAVAEKIGDQCAAWHGIGARDVEEVLHEAARYGLIHGVLAEPVAWMYHGIRYDGTPHDRPTLIWRPDYMDAMSHQMGAKAIPLYAASSQREWVGLTEGEVDACFESAMFNSDVTPTKVLFYEAIEAKLKEKNT